MAAGAQNLFGVQPSNVGLGAGVRPTAANISGPSGFHPSIEAQGLMVHQNAPIIPNNTEMLQLQEQYDAQEAIRQKKLDKLAELRGMEDLNAGVSAPKPQMVGAGSGMRNFQPIASGPLKKPDDILNAPFLQGLY